MIVHGPHNASTQTSTIDRCGEQRISIWVLLLWVGGARNESILLVELTDSLFRSMSRTLPVFPVVFCTKPQFNKKSWSLSASVSVTRKQLNSSSGENKSISWLPILTLALQLHRCRWTSSIVTEEIIFIRFCWVRWSMFFFLRLRGYDWAEPLINRSIYPDNIIFFWLSAFNQICTVSNCHWWIQW